MPDATPAAAGPILRVAIVEDEPLAAERLRRLLRDYPGGRVDVTGEAESVAEAVAGLPTWAPLDLLLCDIRLADGLSFNIWDHAEVPCPTVFTTAYEEYALRAFKVNSIDYLLKPIAPAELYAALDSAQRSGRGRAETGDAPAPAATASSAALPAALTPELLAEVAAMVRARRSYRERLLSRVGDKLVPIDVSAVAFAQSIDRITWVYDFEGRRHPVSETLEQLEEALDPRAFRRLNRAVIASARAVEKLTAYSNSRYRAHLRGHAGEPVIVARDRVGGVRDWLAGG